MSVDAAELGNAFVRTCFALFQGDGLFLYLTGACLAWLLVKRREGEKLFWRSYVLFLFLVIYNPFLIWRLVALLGLDDEYYRFLWLIPMTIVLAYSGSRLILDGKKKWRPVYLAGVILAILLCGKTIFSRSWEWIENIYKIPDEVIEICEIIRADSPKEEPCVAADFDLDVLINQYAPDIDLILSYREIASIRELEARGDDIDSAAKRLYYVLVAGEEYNYWYSEGYLDYALREGQVDYIVTARGNPAREYIAASQCRLIAELEEYCIFRVEIEEQT